MLLGVLIFALDTMHGITDEAAARVNDSVGYTAATAPPVAEAPNRFEIVVAEANGILRAPFEGVVPPDANAWTRELVPALLALLVWGVGLSWVAGAVSRPRQRYVSTRVP